MSGKKFELTDETIKFRDRTLSRIRALKDGKWGKKGVLGGYVEKEGNLSQDDDCWIYNNAKVFDRARVLGNAIVARYSSVYDNSRVSGDAQVSGNSRVFGNSQVSDHVRVDGDDKVCGNMYIKYADVTNFNYSIIGSKHAVNYVGNKDGKPMIMVGCIEHDLDYWLKHYEEIGIENGYSDKEILEYSIHLLYLSSLLTLSL